MLQKESAAVAGCICFCKQANTANWIALTQTWSVTLAVNLPI